jgi:hypothetical protein
LAIHPPQRKLFARPKPFASSVSRLNFTTLRSSSVEYRLMGTSCPQSDRHSRPVGESAVPQNVGDATKRAPAASKRRFQPWMWSAFSSPGLMGRSMRLVVSVRSTSSFV